MEPEQENQTPDAWRNWEQSYEDFENADESQRGSAKVQMALRKQQLLDDYLKGGHDSAFANQDMEHKMWDYRKLFYDQEIRDTNFLEDAADNLTSGNVIDSWKDWRLGKMTYDTVGDVQDIAKATTNRQVRDVLGYGEKLNPFSGTVTSRKTDKFLPQASTLNPTGKIAQIAPRVAEFANKAAQTVPGRAIAGGVQAYSQAAAKTAPLVSVAFAADAALDEALTGHRGNLYKTENPNVAKAAGIGEAALNSLMMGGYDVWRANYDDRYAVHNQVAKDPWMTGKLTEKVISPFFKAYENLGTMLHQRNLRNSKPIQQQSEDVTYGM